MNILVSAYSCVPNRGSEPGVGWNSALQAARFHDVWVLTHDEGREEIKATLAKEAIPRIKFVYLDLPSWALFWKRGRRGAQLHYYLWQLAAYFAGRRLHRKISFDLIHHVTLVRYWMPTFLAFLPIPLIWGPVGGGESAPRSFWASFSFRGKVHELIRDFARKMGERDLFTQHTAKKAIIGLATTEETADRMRILGCPRVSIVTQLGLSREEIRLLSTIPHRDAAPFRLISIGNLLHWKGFDLGLKAFALLCRDLPESEYWLIGDGPERTRLERLARESGVAANVRFLGTLPRWQALEKLGQCDVLIHPSLHDSGGGVCLEAMAAGRPVVCLDLGGPALQVNDESGVKVSADTPRQAVQGLANAIRKLACDSHLRTRLSLGARKRVEDHFNWEKKGLLMAQLYESVSAVGEETEAASTIGVH